MNRARALVAGSCLVMAALVGCSPTEPSAIGPRSGSAAEVAPVQENPAPEPTADVSTTPAEEPSPSDVDEVADACSHLGADAVATLAGAELEPRPHDVGGVPACIWGNLNTIGVQVILVGAEVWATGLPSNAEQLLAEPLYADQISEDERATLEEAIAAVEAGEQIEPARACEMFELMLFHDAQLDGANYTVRIVPSADDPQAITAQGCIEGVFGSVLLVRPDLTGSDHEAERVGDVALTLLDAE
ncbi:hypothetical protein EXU48_08460 [Occultella glacieicola]|uniref:DUF3558 domain-containing protein n=1 Tax=Occultella glacieicola TaxID=2518684 RepID=A0ABY2E460_9MICO|nr:hypothetical protein [Occultella glacieicola]TDE94819.1 hypothetical protein EXU48_08460 [Occultella glacieicola]